MDRPTGVFVSQKGIMRPYALQAAILSIAISLIYIILTLFTDVPLGIPGEWSWQRINDFSLPLISSTFISLCFVFTSAAAFIVDRVLKKKWHKIGGILFILSIGGMIDYQILFLGRAGVTENIYTILDEYSTGYLTQAAKVTSSWELLENFHHALAADEISSNHVDVHPPGNILLFYLCLELCREFPVTKSVVRISLPEATITRILSQNTSYLFSEFMGEPAAFFGACILLLIFTVALSLARMIILLTSLNIKGGWENIGLCTLTLITVPSPILFIGHYDTFNFFLGSVFFLFFAQIFFSTKQCLSGFATGVILGSLMFFSIGFSILIPFVILALIIVESPNRKHFMSILWFISGGLTVILCSYLFHVKIIEIIYYCIRNNMRFFAENMRSETWMMINFIEFIAFTGGVVSAITILEFKRSRLIIPNWSNKRDPIKMLWIVYLLFLIILCVNPFSRGEIGRLFLLYMPIPVILSCSKLQQCELSAFGWGGIALACYCSLFQIMVFRSQLKLAFVF